MRMIRLIRRIALMFLGRIAWRIARKRLARIMRVS